MERKKESGKDEQASMYEEEKYSRFVYSRIALFKLKTPYVISLNCKKKK